MISMTITSILRTSLMHRIEKHTRKKEAKALLKHVKLLVQKEQERERYEQQHRNFRIGNEFEDYVIRMFDPRRFELIHRTPTNKDTNGKFVQSMAYPDLRFREISSGKQFWVEVKYRSRTEKRGNITWCSYPQLCNYKKARTISNEPVFIVLGVGGNTKEPDKVYCMDLKNVNYTTLYYNSYKSNRLYYRKIDSLNQLMMISSLHQNIRRPRIQSGERDLGTLFLLNWNSVPYTR